MDGKMDVSPKIKTAPVPVKALTAMLTPKKAPSHNPPVNHNSHHHDNNNNTDDDFLLGCGGVDDELFFQHLDATEDFTAITPVFSRRSPPSVASDLTPLLTILQQSLTTQAPTVGPDAGVTSTNAYPAVDPSIQLDGTPTASAVIASPAQSSPPRSAAGVRPIRGLDRTANLGAAREASFSTAEPPGQPNASSRHRQPREHLNRAAGVSSSKAIHKRRSAIRRRTAQETSPTNAADAEYPTVCMLVVSGNGRHRRSANPTASLGSSTTHEQGEGGIGATDAKKSAITALLTEELHRHGLKPEIDHVASEERAIQRVKALARHGLWYRMVVVEVDGSLTRAAATARDLRATNPTAPIVAVAPPHAIRDTIASSSSNHSADAGAGRGAQLSAKFPPWEGRIHGEVLRHFSEFLTTPVTRANARGLVTRWLLRPLDRTGGEDDAEERRATAGGGATNSKGRSKGDLTVRLSRPRGSMAEPVRGSHGGVSTEDEQEDRGLAGGARNTGTAGWNERSRDGRRDRDYQSHRDAFLDERDTHSAAATVRSSSSSNSTPDNNSSTSAVIGSSASLKGRVFGGTEADRATPCRLFSESFEKENTDFEEREYNFVFKHGSVVLKVEEDRFGRVTPMVCAACEYTTEHLGNLCGKPLQVLLTGAATNRQTARSILQHIEEGGTDSMCSYINLKSEKEGRREVASFVSVRPLSKRPERTSGGPEQQLPAWYVLLKVCLPSTLGLIKEPALLEKMYSRAAMAVKGRSSTKRRGAGGANKSYSKSTNNNGLDNTNSRSKPPIAKRTPKRSRISSGLTSASSTRNSSSIYTPCVPPTTNSADTGSGGTDTNIGINAEEWNTGATTC